MQRIYVTTTEFFTANFRPVFSNTPIKHVTGKDSHTWLAGPNMRYWPQQLNFALWCATTGCGISRQILFGKDLKLGPQLQSFFACHVYFTARRIRFVLGGIQSASTLPDDPTFIQTDSHYGKASYQRLCAEFGDNPSADFRFNFGQNHGLGYIYLNYPESGDFAQK